MPIVFADVPYKKSSKFDNLYSLVPKERHVRKEGNGSTLWLSNGPKESHDSTVVKKLFQKGVMTAVLV